MSNAKWLRYGKPITEALRGVLSEVHAVRATQDTPLPYCVYRRAGLDRLVDALDKDSEADAYGASYEVHIYTAKYTEGLDLVERILSALKQSHTIEVELTDSSEDSAEDGLQFLQSITISVR